mgnify:CR=1 FL=1
MDKVLERKESSHLSLGNRQVVKKHVAAIHCSNKLSLLERRASNALLFHAMPSLKKTLSHKIRIAELKSLLGFNSRNHAQLKRAIIRLTEVTVRWNLCGDKIDGETGNQVCGFREKEDIEKLDMDFPIVTKKTWGAGSEQVNYFETLDSVVDDETTRSWTGDSIYPCLVQEYEDVDYDIRIHIYKYY